MYRSGLISLYPITPRSMCIFNPPISLNYYFSNNFISLVYKCEHPPTICAQPSSILRHAHKCYSSSSNDINLHCRSCRSRSPARDCSFNFFAKIIGLCRRSLLLYYSLQSRLFLFHNVFTNGCLIISVDSVANISYWLPSSSFHVFAATSSNCTPFPIPLTLSPLLFTYEP